MIDTYIRMGIKQSGVEATYRFINNPKTKQVEVTFEYKKKEKVVPKKEETSKPRETKKETKKPSFFLGIKKKIQSFFASAKSSEAPLKSSTYKDGPLIYLVDKGGVDTYISGFDLRKSNNFFVKSSNPSQTYSDISNHNHYITAELEGIIASIFAKYDDGVAITFVLGMDYDEFQNHLLLGHQKAKDTYQEITNGVSLPTDYLVLLIYLYLQKNVKYNHAYMRKIMKNPNLIETQEIDNAMAFGALNNHEAICEGISWAMIKILESAGVHARPAYGAYEGGNHQWVKVKIDKEWYNVDPTFSYISPHYGVRNFLISDKKAFSKGYSDESPLKATSTRYEDKALNIFIDKFKKDINNYCLKGLPKKWKNIDIDIL